MIAACIITSFMLSKKMSNGLLLDLKYISLYDISCFNHELCHCLIMSSLYVFITGTLHVPPTCNLAIAAFICLHTRWKWICEFCVCIVMLCRDMWEIRAHVFLYKYGDLDIFHEIFLSSNYLTKHQLYCYDNSK
jgi:hypothetical protein